MSTAEENKGRLLIFSRKKKKNEGNMNNTLQQSIIETYKIYERYCIVFKSGTHINILIYQFLLFRDTEGVLTGWKLKHGIFQKTFLFMSVFCSLSLCVSASVSLCLSLSLSLSLSLPLSLFLSLSLSLSFSLSLGHKRQSLSRSQRPKKAQTHACACN